MFCTTLRARQGLKGVIPQLQAQRGLSLKESKLASHDIEIALSPGTSKSNSLHAKSRVIRFLLMTQDDLSPNHQSTTIDRIKRFGSLTGGTDIAIVFVLEQDSPGKRGSMSVYAELQCLLSADADIPSIPCLLCLKLADLTSTVTTYLSNLGQSHALVTPPPMAPVELVSHCTTSPPLNDLDANLATDIFSSLQELAEACDAAARHADHRAQSRAGYAEDEGERGLLEKLDMLRQQMGDRAFRDLVAFFVS